MGDSVNEKRLIYKEQTESEYSIFYAEGDEEDFAPNSKLHNNLSAWGEVFSNESKANVLRYSKHKFTDNSSIKYGVWIEDNEDGTYEGKVRLPNMEKE